jgi:hypothetical protein
LPLTRAAARAQIACREANNGDTLLTVAIAPHQARRRAPRLRSLQAIHRR